DWHNTPPRFQIAICLTENVPLAAAPPKSLTNSRRSTAQCLPVRPSHSHDVTSEPCFFVLQRHVFPPSFYDGRFPCPQVGKTAPAESPSWLSCRCCAFRRRGVAAHRAGRKELPFFRQFSTDGSAAVELSPEPLSRLPYRTERALTSHDSHWQS